MDEQVVLVAGATGSIGGAAALALAKRGARVVLLGREQDKLDLKAAQIKRQLSGSTSAPANPLIDTLVIDFSNLEGVKDVAADVRKRYININAIVYSVGILKQDGPNILPDGHEFMFATNVIGPFLFTRRLMDRLEDSKSMVLHVIAPFYKAIDWDNVESIKNHRPMVAFDRTKTCNRIFAGELARRFAGKVTSVAFDPTYVIDKTDPDLYAKWPSGMTGLFWKMMTLLFAKHPSIAGEPIARLILENKDRDSLNGSLFKLDKQIKKADKAMTDEVEGRKLWEALAKMTDDL